MYVIQKAKTKGASTSLSCFYGNFPISFPRSQTSGKTIYKNIVCLLLEFFGIINCSLKLTLRRFSWPQVVVPLGQSWRVTECCVTANLFINLASSYMFTFHRTPSTDSPRTEPSPLCALLSSYQSTFDAIKYQSGNYLMRY